MRIAKLEPSKHVQERWLVFFDDGALLRLGEGELVELGLYQGMEVTEALYGRMAEASQMGTAKAKALDALSHRPLSRKELVDKLTERPRRRRDGAQPEPAATPEQAAAVADWLEELGYLNDGEYARTVARHYSAKGWGERKVRDELWRRGVPRALWEEALEAARPPEEGVDAFLQKRFRGGEPDQRELKRAADALARRGYRWGEIREGLNRYGAGLSEDEE